MRNGMIFLPSSNVDPEKMTISRTLFGKKIELSEEFEHQNVKFLTGDIGSCQAFSWQHLRWLLGKSLIMRTLSRSALTN
jgi:hypothetical protein